MGHLTNVTNRCRAHVKCQARGVGKCQSIKCGESTQSLHSLHTQTHHERVPPHGLCGPISGRCNDQR